MSPAFSTAAAGRAAGINEFPRACSECSCAAGKLPASRPVAPPVLEVLGGPRRRASHYEKSSSAAGWVSSLD